MCQSAIGSEKGLGVLGRNICFSRASVWRLSRPPGRWNWEGSNALDNKDDAILGDVDRVGWRYLGVDLAEKYRTN